MARDHYIPATYLAIFSDEVSLPRRNRTLCVINKRTGAMFRSNAGAICSPIDFYNYGGGDWPTDDRHEFLEEKRKAFEALAGLVKMILNPPADNVVQLTGTK
jgi:hypothetical protein